MLSKTGFNSELANEIEQSLGLALKPVEEEQEIQDVSALGDVSAEQKLDSALQLLVQAAETFENLGLNDQADKTQSLIEGLGQEKTAQETGYPKIPGNEDPYMESKLIIAQLESLRDHLKRSKFHIYNPHTTKYVRQSTYLIALAVKELLEVKDIMGGLIDEDTANLLKKQQDEKEDPWGLKKHQKANSLIEELTKIAKKQKENKKKTKSDKKKSKKPTKSTGKKTTKKEGPSKKEIEEAAKDLTPEKAVSNLREHGWLFDLPSEEDFGMADDENFDCGDEHPEFMRKNEDYDGNSWLDRNKVDDDLTGDFNQADDFDWLNDK